MKYKDLDLSGIRKLAKELAGKDGNKHRVFGLVGPLGAGKTTFTQALASHLGAKNVKSPTFTVVNCYDGRNKSLYHIDLYRLEKAKELDAIGLEEILEDEKAVVCIEWADKFPKVLERCDAIVNIEVRKGDLRNVTVTTNKN